MTHNPMSDDATASTDAREDSADAAESGDEDAEVAEIMVTAGVPSAEAAPTSAPSPTAPPAMTAAPPAMISLTSDLANLATNDATVPKGPAGTSAADEDEDAELAGLTASAAVNGIKCEMSVEPSAPKLPAKAADSELRRDRTLSSKARSRSSRDGRSQGSGGGDDVAEADFAPTGTSRSAPATKALFRWPFKLQFKGHAAQ